MLVQKPTKKSIQKARRILRQGGLIVYPTDTLYGLGADIFNKQAVKEIFKLKGRDFKKPISIMVANLSSLRKLAWVDKKQEQFIRALLPGPFTLILKKKKIIYQLLTAGKNKVGIRIPDSKICLKLSRNLPITTTSANISGQKPSRSVKKLTKLFSIKDENRVDLILEGKNLSNKPSTVIDLTEMPPKILR